MHVDLLTTRHIDKRFNAARAKVVEFIDYMRAAGKTPCEIRLFPADYSAITGAFNRDFKRRAREQERQENAGRKRTADKVKVTPEHVESVRFGEIPVVCGDRYSRPRKFEA